MIKCISCGRFISYADTYSGAAHYHHEWDSDFGPEVNEWTCRTCVEAEEERRNQRIIITPCTEDDHD